MLLSRQKGSPLPLQAELFSGVSVSVFGARCQECPPCPLWASKYPWRFGLWHNPALSIVQVLLADSGGTCLRLMAYVVSSCITRIMPRLEKTWHQCFGSGICLPLWYNASSGRRSQHLLVRAVVFGSPGLKETDRPDAPMPDHEYSKLMKEDDEALGVDNVSENQCIDSRQLRSYRLLKLALAASTMVLALALVAITILVSRITSVTLCPSTGPRSWHSTEYRSTGLGRDSRYMTRNHSADALWDVMLEDHLGEYTTPDGPFDRAEFSM